MNAKHSCGLVFKSWRMQAEWNLQQRQFQESLKHSYYNAAVADPGTTTNVPKLLEEVSAHYSGALPKPYGEGEYCIHIHQAAAQRILAAVSWKILNVDIKCKEQVAQMNSKNYIWPTAFRVMQ